MKTSEGEYIGFCIDLLREMARILKFNYTIIEVQDGSYGIEVVFSDYWRKCYIQQVND